MLLILVQKVVKDLFIKKGDTLKVIARSWLERNDLIDKSVRLMGQICDVLLPLHLLFYISRIVTDL